MFLNWVYNDVDDENENDVNANSFFSFIIIKIDFAFLNKINSMHPQFNALNWFIYSHSIFITKQHQITSDT